MSKQASQFERDGGIEVLYGRFGRAQEAQRRTEIALSSTIGQEISPYERQVHDARATASPSESQPAAEFPEAVQALASRLAQPASEQSALLNPLFPESNSPAQPQPEQYTDDNFAAVA